MAGELNTEVLDDPASCRTTTRWLGTVKPGVAQIGDVIYAQRGASEGCWQGTAGEAARQTLTVQGQDCDTLEGLVGQVKAALETFADEIGTVNARMAQARTAAREGKLIVIPTAILPPEPSSLPPGSMGQQVDAYNASQEKKQRAFEEAKATVEAARTQQDEAHQALEKAMKDPLATVKTTKTYAMFVVGQGLSTIKASTDAAGELFQKADRWNDVASTLQARAIQHSGHVRDLFTRAAASHEKVADAATTRAANAQKLGGPVGPKARAIISADASDLVKSTSKVGQFGSKALRGVPFVGTGVTLISGGVDVAMGKDVWETAEDTTTDLAGGAAGGWAGAAIGTAICPGVGTVIGGVVGGIAGSMLATSGVNAATGE